MKELARLPVEQSPNLTHREIETLKWTALGKTAPETATILGISKDTVGFHIKNSCRKLNANNKTNAATIALDQGLFQLQDKVQKQIVAFEQNKGVPPMNTRIATMTLPRKKSMKKRLTRSNETPEERDEIGQLEEKIMIYLKGLDTIDGDMLQAKQAFLIVLKNIVQIKINRR